MITVLVQATGIQPSPSASGPATLKEVRFAGNRLQAPSQESLADELAVFANGRGGVAVLGVEDETRICHTARISRRSMLGLTIFAASAPLNEEPEHERAAP